MRVIVAAVALLVSFAALAAPPYDVTATVVAPSSGGAVDAYTLYMDGKAVGQVGPGVNTLPGLITKDGTYVFTVGAKNAAGETLSDPVTAVVSSLEAPGKPGLTIQLTCAPSCIVSVTQ